MFESSPLTAFEQDVSNLIEPALGKGSGTHWSPLTQRVSLELGVSSDRVGAISIKTSGVIGNRLCTPGIIRSAPDIFIVVSLEEDYKHSTLIERTKELVPLTRHLTTVLIARRQGPRGEASNSNWRIIDAVVVDGLHKLALCRPHFPALKNVVHLPITPLGEVSTDMSTGPRAWYTYEELPDTVHFHRETVSAQNAPAPGEMVMYVNRSGTSGAPLVGAYGLVESCRLVDDSHVDIAIGRIRRLRQEIDAREFGINVSAEVPEIVPLLNQPPGDDIEPA